VRLFSYVVARDWGFAPNPFHDYCTLATCKWQIRGTAQVGDWVMGTGSARYNRRDFLVYAMRVTEIMDFDEYWFAGRFADKRPRLQGSRKQQYGDNIYHRDGEDWIQADSHHSFAGGIPNKENLDDDTKRPRVLISDDFAYWGGSGPRLPDELRDFPGGMDLCQAGQGYRCHFPQAQIEAFVSWFRSLGASGVEGAPLNWRRPSSE
jgi:hypothetical protein